MTEVEWRAFLEAGTRTGKLATTRRDGRPHVVPIWFVLDGDEVVFNTGAGTVKGRSLARPAGPACVLTTSDRRTRS
jgi:nitroimidazol reductase NimA-like FMN-containing flavoprotein (pyridoxamine 5'-phosphate oxidase superfamily)